MPTIRPTPGIASDQTPAGELREACLVHVLGYQLMQAAIVTNAIFRRHAGEPLDLGRVQFTVLTLMAENPGASSAQFARALAITPAHVSGSIDRLVERGLVQRGQGADDRRSRALRITSAGSEVVREAAKDLVSAEEAALPLSEGERGILLELLHKVACARDLTRRCPD